MVVYQHQVPYQTHHAFPTLVHKTTRIRRETPNMMETIILNRRYHHRRWSAVALSVIFVLSLALYQETRFLAGFMGSLPPSSSSPSSLPLSTSSTDAAIAAALRHSSFHNHSSDSNSSHSSTTMITVEQDDVMIEHRRTRPTFVMHIGPSKTATTSLQDGLNSMPDILAQDHYKYLGQYWRGQFPRKESIIQVTLLNKDQCLHQLRDFLLLESNQNDDNNQSATAAAAAAPRMAEVECWKKAHNEIQHRRQQNQNVIISSEHGSYKGQYDNPQIFAGITTALHQALDDQWNVIVLVGYRRYFEWTASAYRQSNANGCLNTRPRRNNQPIQPRLCPELWPKIQQWMNQNPPSAQHYIYTDKLTDLWTRAGFQVKILNFHDAPGGDLVQKFVCDILSDAPHTCAYTKSQNPKISNARVSTTAAYSNIAFEATKRNLLDGVNSSTPLHTVVKEMEEYFQGKLNLTYRHLPLQCPPRSGLERLLKISLAKEEAILPDFYKSPNGKQAHIESFWQAANDRKEFCTVDVESVLGNRTSWEEVLKVMASGDYS